MSCQTMVLFCNDATEVRYSDGSRLQLSPCGASFTFWYSPLSRHSNQAPMLLCNKSIQQRTRYALSEYKTRVLQALEFRNQFAAHPYLCTDVIDTRCLVQIYSNIQEASWPSSSRDADIKRLPDGDIQITSIDQCASLTLSNTRQQFSVEFLCNVPREGTTKNHNKKVEIHDEDVQQKHQSQNAGDYGMSSQEQLLDNENVKSEQLLKYLSHNAHLATSECSHGNNATHTLCTGEKPGSYQYKPTERGNAKSQQTLKDLSHNVPVGGCIYVWVVQHYSVDDCPTYWRHPLQLAMRIPPMAQETGTTIPPEKTGIKDDSSSAQHKHEIQENTKAPNLVHTRLPSALPVNCPASHMHTWKDSKIHIQDSLQDTYALEMEYVSNGGVKVLMVNGIIYRLLSAGGPCIEIYPGDHSVIKSCHQPGGIAGDIFFIQYTAAPDGCIEEKMYSTSNLPPDRPGCSYSLSSVLARGSRLLQMNLCHTDGSTSSLPCWKVIQQDPILPKSQIPPVLLEEKNIIDVGRFSAFSDGYIRITFTDRTVLDWRCDLSPCVDRRLRNKEGMHKDCHRPNQQRRIPFSDTCRLLLPNGHYVLVDVQQAAEEYHRYISVAEEWRTWVNLEPSDRVEFYQQQFINHPYRAVHDELQKIHNFTYITETIPTYRPRIVDVKDEPDGNNERRSANDHCQETDDSYGVTRRPIIPQQVACNSDVSLDMIEEALSKTSQAISSIDNLLEH